MIRRRMPVGLNEIGEPIMRQLQAKTEYELMLRAAKLIVESGVLGNYILIDGTPEKKEEKKSISFRDMAEWWYRVYKQDNPTLKPATSNDYRRMLDKVIYPVLGDKLIHEITMTCIQELLNEEKNMAASTQTKMLVTLRQIFDMAIQEQYITINPAKGKLTKTGVEKREGRALS